MTIIFYLLCVVVGLFITYILGVQFYKLGQNLKERFPIIFRIYSIFWGLLGAIFLISILAVIKIEIDNHQQKKKIEKIDSIFNVYASDLDLKGKINEAKNEGFSDKQIYEYLKQSKKLKIAFDELANKGITDYEIGEYLNLDPDNNYVSDAQRAANEAVAAAEQAQQVVNNVENTQNSDVKLAIQNTNGLQNSMPQDVQEEKRTYQSFEIFIAPDLQEKVGVDKYQLQSMIADAKTAKKEDKQILNMLRETNQFGNIIKEYEKSGLSEHEIAEKFGLSI